MEEGKFWITIVLISILGVLGLVGLIVWSYRVDDARVERLIKEGVDPGKARCAVSPDRVYCQVILSQPSIVLERLEKQ